MYDTHTRVTHDVQYMYDTHTRYTLYMLHTIRNTCMTHIHMTHNGYTPMGYTTQDNLQIQCNLYQMNNGIFHITKTKYLNIV